MGVKACSRADCEYIGCDHLIENTYYLCQNCLTELKDVMGDWPDEMTRLDMSTRIADFLKTSSDETVLHEKIALFEELVTNTSH